MDDIKKACEEIKRLAELVARVTDERQRQKIFASISNIAYFLSVGKTP